MLFLQKPQRHYTLEDQLYGFLTSASDGGECSGSSAGHLTSEKKNAGSHWIWRWVGSRHGLHAFV